MQSFNRILPATNLFLYKSISSGSLLAALLRDSIELNPEPTICSVTSTIFRRPMPKPRYKTTNRKQYSQSLINRGSLTFWIDEEAISGLAKSKQNKCVRPRRVTDGAVLPNLLKQTGQSILEVSADGAYYTRACHAAIKIKGAIALIPPRAGQPSGSGGTIETVLNKGKMEIKKMALRTSSPSESSEED